MVGTECVPGLSPDLAALIIYGKIVQTSVEVQIRHREMQLPFTIAKGWGSYARLSSNLANRQLKKYFSTFFSPAIKTLNSSWGRRIRLN